MARVFRKRPDLVFVLSTATSGRSFEEHTLKADEVPYEVGTLIVPEVDGSDVKTGLHVRATALTLADAGKEIAIVGTRTFADEENTPVLTVARDAEVKSFEVEIPAGTTIADVTAALAIANIIVR